MAAPKRTTFEVTVTNRLSHPILTTIQAELKYTQQFSISDTSYDSLNNYQQTANANARSDYNANSNLSSSVSYNSNQQSSSNSINVGVKVNALGFGDGSVDVDHKSADSSSNVQFSKHFNASSNTSANSAQKSSLNIDSNANISQKSSAASGKVANKIIDPGFVRIAPNQSLSIPVVVQSESQIAYITINITNEQGEKLCIANQLQINSSHIQVVNVDNYIRIQPVIQVKQ